MKEIIIDGVNVAECEYCIENPLKDFKYSCNCRGYEKENGLHIHLKCENNPNCYFKQLKRLEQENKKLKKEIKQLTEWKRKAVTCQECYDEGVATADIKINRYKSALEEIREIIERQLRNCSCNLTDYKSGCKGCESKYAREIAIEINEVLK